MACLARAHTRAEKRTPTRAGKRVQHQASRGTRQSACNAHCEELAQRHRGLCKAIGSTAWDVYGRECARARVRGGEREGEAARANACLGNRNGLVVTRDHEQLGVQQVAPKVHEHKRVDGKVGERGVGDSGPGQRSQGEAVRKGRGRGRTHTHACASSVCQRPSASAR